MLFINNNDRYCGNSDYGCNNNPGNNEQNDSNNNMVIRKKPTENVENEQNWYKCMFSCNLVHPHFHERLFLHISVVTITTFPVRSLIFLAGL